jgi:hypothetical protein
VALRSGDRSREPRSASTAIILGVTLPSPQRLAGRAPLPTSAAEPPVCARGDNKCVTRGRRCFGFRTDILTPTLTVSDCAETSHPPTSAFASQRPRSSLPLRRRKSRQRGARRVIAPPRIRAPASMTPALAFVISAACSGRSEPTESSRWRRRVVDLDDRLGEEERIHRRRGRPVGRARRHGPWLVWLSARPEARWPQGSSARGARGRRARSRSYRCQASTRT